MALQNTPDSQSTLATRAVKDVFPVSRLVREARVLLESGFPLLWVEGEISNLAMPASGHIYFSLKDEAAQVRCAMFRNRNRQLRFVPENGMQVLLRVRVTLYENRGEFQLVIEHMEEAGSGALQRAYEALKHRLGEAGLFDAAHKRDLPSMPSTVGIISSPDGAAVHDILSVLKRRFPSIKIILYPVAVQGEQSASQLRHALHLAQARQECDVLIIGRGGGSLEDLWSFNDEQLAHAMYQCTIPIVSAVGHEVDFTIADFVADVRAPTPSAAAELVVPDVRQVMQTLNDLHHRMTTKLQHLIHTEQRHLSQLGRRVPSPLLRLQRQTERVTYFSKSLTHAWRNKRQQAQQSIDYLAARLIHPTAKIREHQRHIVHLQQNIHRVYREREKQYRYHYALLSARLNKLSPQTRLQQEFSRLARLQVQLENRIKRVIETKHTALQQQIRTMGAVSPLNTLERGYSITTQPGGRVITQVNQVSEGDAVIVQLHQGELTCEVKQKHE